ncbi:MAG TPA: class I SAM-dependent methyltransferase [Desulfosporosinus sp.]|nr:class I SAM-dependent methyltransferase [Desulfosporosinus sp.]
MQPTHHLQLIEVLKERFGEKPIVGIETGTYCGDSATQILNNTNCTKLYTIDPWLHGEGKEFEAGEPQPYHDKNMSFALRRMEQFGDRVEIMRMTSEAAYHELLLRDPEFKVNFVWIDGDHSKEGVTTDIAFENIILPGGLIGGHDYGQCHPLTEIILEKYGNLINAGGDFTWWVHL